MRAVNTPSPAALALAADLLNLGPGCRDGGCELGGPGTHPGAMHTNGGCKCLADRPDGSRRELAERWALREAVRAAAAVLERHT